MSRPSLGFPGPVSRLSPAGGDAAAAAGADLTAVLGPVRSQNTFEETVERLLAVIKLGVVGPGERFPSERELAALLGVSRITLREAIGDLRAAGYVESRRGRFGGTFVIYTPPGPSRVELRRIAVEDADRINDALTFRMAVETGAAQILAQVEEGGRDGDGRAGERIRDVLLTRLAAVNQACPGGYRRMDTLFHLAVAELTGSSLLASACADARVRLNDLLNAIPVLQRNIEHTAAQHTAIVEAILAGDTRRAQRAVAEHLDGTAALLRGFLEGPSAGVNRQPGCGG
jgi:DNA-binding FadR family transcriptional regulator